MNAGPADGNWLWLTGTGNNSDVLASGASGAENAPELKTTLSGLANGQYDLFAYFWANTTQDWRFPAELDPNNLLLFRDNGVQQAELAQFDGAVQLTSGSGAALYRVYVGRASVLNGSPVNVFLDDLANDASMLTWYDGLGYVLVSTPFPGDFNGDHSVDTADYVVWRKGLGTTYTQNDYNIWRAHFGQATGSGATGSASARVPEPSPTLLLVFAALRGHWLRQCSRPRHSPKLMPKSATACIASS